jgi:serine protease Do
MPSHPSPSQKGRILPRHRVALMASAMAVTGALLFAAPGGHLSLGPAPAIAQAQTVQTHGPAGFADIVQKVKPAVVSVRVKLKNQVSSSDSSSGDSKDQAPSFPKGSPFERFFREFGWPNQPNGRTLRPFTMAQGSAFSYQRTVMR